MSRSILALIVFTLVSPMAHAYKDGVYRCKNPDSSLPPVVYKIVSVDVPLAGGKVPYVEVTNYYHDDPRSLSSPVHETHIKGFATVSTTDEGNETLLLGELHLEMQSDALTRCMAVETRRVP